MRLSVSLYLGIGIISAVFLGAGESKSETKTSNFSKIFPEIEFAPCQNTSYRSASECERGQKILIRAFQRLSNLKNFRGVDDEGIIPSTFYFSNFSFEKYDSKTYQDYTGTEVKAIANCLRNKCLDLFRQNISRNSNLSNKLYILAYFYGCIIDTVLKADFPLKYKDPRYVYSYYFNAADAGSIFNCSTSNYERDIKAFTFFDLPSGSLDIRF